MNSQLKAARRARGLAIGGLSVMSGVSPSLLTAIEKWGYVPGANTQQRIAAALELQVEHIWTRGTQPSGGSGECLDSQAIGLAFAGVQGFLQNLDALYEQNDEESSEWEAFLVAWSEVFGEDTVTVADLCDTLLPAGASRQQRLAVTDRSVSDEQSAALREALPGELAEGLEIEQMRVGSVVSGSAGTGFRRKLGKALAKRIDVRYGDLRLEKASATLMRR